MLGVPVLAGSSAYAVGEAAAWKTSLKQKPHSAKRFYTVIGISMAIGMGMDFMGFNAVSMLFWSAVLNGVLAPPLVFLVVMLTSDRKVMEQHVSPPLLRILGWITGVVMSLAALAMIVFSIAGSN